MPTMPLLLRVAALLLMFLTLSSAQESSLYVDYEGWDNYVHFTDEMKELLEKEFQALMRGPHIKVFTYLPEPETQRIWPYLKGITVRNHVENKILWTEPNYFIQDGLKMGCREEVNGIVSEVQSGLCQEHCTHKGRYCAPIEPAALPSYLQQRGREIVKESLRRLCMDGYYHASDHKYFDYLEGFERSQCFQAVDVTSCALQVINSIAHLDYAKFIDCVGGDLDTENEKLEQQLFAAKDYNLDGVSELPFMTIGNQRYTGAYTVADMLQGYCDKMPPDNMKPVACDICGQCGDVRKCLWTLECDGVPFDPVAFVQSHTEGGGDTSGSDVNGGEAEAEPSANPADTSAPGPEMTVPVATLPPDAMASSESNNYSPEEEDQDEPNSQVILTFFVTAIVLSALVAGFFSYRDRRTRTLMAEISAEQVAQDSYSYRDNQQQESYMDFKPEKERNLEMSPTSGGGNPGGGAPPMGAFLPIV